jgi:hypothetical protein
VVKRKNTKTLKDQCFLETLRRPAFCFTKCLGYIKFHYMLEQLISLIRTRKCRYIWSQKLIVCFKPYLLNNLQDKANQHETVLKTDSSETIRGNFFILLKSTYDFSDYLFVKPSQKKKIKSDFLEWFIGFSEGDGSFTYKDGRPVFVINQADLGLLRRLRTQLGFGRVETFTQNNRLYARFKAENQKNVERIISIFNGNIQLRKVYIRFSKWINTYNKVYKKQVILKQRRKVSEIHLNSAWLSGFFDAEGGFSTSLSKNANLKLGYRLYFKAYIDQKNEFAILSKIANLFEVSNVSIRNKKKRYYRVDVNSKKTLQNILTYFEKYPLKSRKRLAYNRWRSLVNTWLVTGVPSLKLSKLKKRVMRIQELNSYFKKLKSVLFLLKELPLK